MPTSIDAPQADDAHPVTPDVPSDDCAEPNPAVPEELSLDKDSDTSMVTSLGLHLVSEHEVWEGASLKRGDAASLHAHLHEHPVDEDDAWGHEEGSTQFRPGRALAAIAARYANDDFVEGMLSSVDSPPTPPA